MDASAQAELARLEQLLDTWGHTPADVQGLSAWVDETFGDLFAGLAQVPLVGWVPLLIIALGLQEPFRVSIIAIAASTCA